MLEVHKIHSLNTKAQTITNIFYEPFNIFQKHVQSQYHNTHSVSAPIPRRKILAYNQVQKKKNLTRRIIYIRYEKQS